MNTTDNGRQRLLRHLLLMGAVGFTASCRASAQIEPPCVFPESSESVITFDYPDEPDSSFHGWVVDPGLNPIEGAQVSLDGSIGALTDGEGRFRFDGLPRGRYQVRVDLIGYRSAADSITYSEFGVRMAAVLVETGHGHRACIRRADEGRSG